MRVIAGTPIEYAFSYEELYQLASRGISLPDCRRRNLFAEFYDRCNGPANMTVTIYPPPGQPFTPEQGEVIGQGMENLVVRFRDRHVKMFVAAANYMLQAVEVTEKHNKEDERMTQ